MNDTEIVEEIKKYMKRHPTPKGMGIIPETIESVELFSFATSFHEDMMKLKEKDIISKLLDEFEAWRNARWFDCGDKTCKVCFNFRALSRLIAAKRKEFGIQ